MKKPISVLVLGMALFFSYSFTTNKPKKTKIDIASELTMTPLPLNFAQQSAIMGGKHSGRNMVLNIADENVKFIFCEISITDLRYYAVYNTVTVLTNGSYRLDMQYDGNFVLYNGGTALWATGRKDAKPGQCYVRFKRSYPRGEFILYNTSANETKSYWYSDILGPFGNMLSPIWVLQDDGNFVLYEGYDYDPATGNVTVTGYPVGATMTQGGIQSNRSGYFR